MLLDAAPGAAEGGINMGVYVKGMEMPTNCEECPIKSWDCESYVCPFSGIDTLSIGRQANCPLVPVPEHGRLIDADGEIGVNVTMMPGGKCRVDLIAPTIIPAEEGE